MLSAVGGTPRLKPDAVRNYPCELPGGLRPGVVVSLSGLTPDVVEHVFMEIERPHHDQSVGGLPDPVSPTIGEFYDAIQKAFESLPGEAVTGNRQVTCDFSTVNNLSVTAITSKADALAAIALIKEEGEGTTTSPLDPSEGVPDGDFSHYY